MLRTKIVCVGGVLIELYSYDGKFWDSSKANLRKITGRVDEIIKTGTTTKKWGEYTKGELTS